jgi:hypothetical protein
VEERYEVLDETIKLEQPELQAGHFGQERRPKAVLFGAESQWSGSSKETLVQLDSPSASSGPRRRRPPRRASVGRWPVGVSCETKAHESPETHVEQQACDDEGRALDIADLWVVPAATKGRRGQSAQQADPWPPRPQRTDCTP